MCRAGRGRMRVCVTVNPVFTKARQKRVNPQSRAAGLFRTGVEGQMVGGPIGLVNRGSIIMLCLLSLRLTVAALPNSVPALMQQDFTVTSNFSYSFNIEIGTPPQMLTVSLDFGSADLILKNGPTSCIGDGCNWNELYTSANFNYSETLRRSNGFVTSPLSSDGVVVSGNWARDNISIGNLGQFSIDEADFLIQYDSLKYYTSDTAYDGFIEMENVLGLGPRGLQATVRWLDHGIPAPTYDNILFSMNSSTPSFSIWVDPTTYQRGTITLGGIDESQYVPGSLIWVPIALPSGLYGAFQEPTYLAIEYVGIDMQFRNRGRQWQREVVDNLISVAILNSRQNFSMPLPLLEYVGKALSAEWASSVGMYVVRCDLEGTFGIMGDSITLEVSIEDLLIQLNMEDMNGAPLCGLNIGEADQMYLPNRVLKNYFVAVDYTNNEIAFGNLSTGPTTGQPQKIVPMNNDTVPTPSGNASEFNSLIQLHVDSVYPENTATTLTVATPKFYSSQTTQLVLGTDPVPSILSPKNYSDADIESTSTQNLAPLTVSRNGMLGFTAVLNLILFML